MKTKLDTTVAFLNVSNGKFELVFDNDWDNKVVVDAKVKALADAFEKYGVQEVGCSSSVDFSEEYGMPDADIAFECAWDEYQQRRK